MAKIIVWALESDRAGFNFLPCHFLAIWARSLIPLNSTVLICKVGVIIALTLEGHCEN